ncbi:FAD-binding oxidoreductase [Nocardioides soli]|uniref:FAD/FMN-containing dehydrogenase n=1 Tax=Nocardioides soli TaxID=1036020 RepID=A0A7W4VV65_9ACTN|nr:FAD-binding oxidoreductase [Nocardioides soli]MBB3042386.1 FAD/FMN-containing dehydrogenase [Nocardioides soli]
MTSTLDTSALDGTDNHLVRPGTQEYDEARTLWNGMIDRRPALIVQPASTEDVAAAVRWAAEAGQPVAVKGGGHSAPGYSMCDDGVVIDLSRIDHADVDPVTCTARLGGGALLGDLDRATAEHELVVPAGAVSHTGAGGLILGGGFGHLMRKHGLSIDSLVGATVVLADGRVVDADEQTEPDLFWALRGGSGNFGIVTEFRLRCHPFGREVYVCAPIVELQHARAALEIWRREMVDAPDELTWNNFFRGAPAIEGFEWVPEHLREQPVLMMPMIWAGDPADGRREIEARLALLDGLVSASTGGVMPFVELQSLFDEVFAHGRRHYAKAGFLTGLPDEVLDVLIEAMHRLPHHASQIELMRLGGAVARVPAEATAFPHRTADWPFNLIGLWDDPAQDPEVRQWVRDLYAALEPHATGGAYVNYAGGEEAGGSRSAYGDGVGGRTWDRLVALKRRYDPTNLFRFNANLAPAE